MRGEPGCHSMTGSLTCVSKDSTCENCHVSFLCRDYHRPIRPDVVQNLLEPRSSSNSVTHTCLDESSHSNIEKITHSYTTSTNQLHPQNHALHVVYNIQTMRSQEKC